MTRELITLKPDTEILRALLLLAEHGISGAPVLDEQGNMIGMLTEKDCIRSALEAAYHSQYTGLVADFMSTTVVGVSPDESIANTAERFLASPYRRYPVVEDSQLIGLISRRDVIRALAEAWQ